MRIGRGFAVGRRNGSGENEVAVVVVEDKDAFVSAAGGDIGIAWEVGESFTANVGEGSEYVVCARWECPSQGRSP
jgi:hypothetical protein